jgi:hypothetical protein
MGIVNTSFTRDSPVRAQEHKVGLVINNFSDIKEQLFESNELKDIVVKKRYEFTIENNINQLIQFYTNQIAQYPN